MVFEIPIPLRKRMRHEPRCDHFIEESRHTSIPGGRRAERGARRMPSAAIEAKVEAFLARSQEKTADRQQPLARNGRGGPGAWRNRCRARKSLPFPRQRQVAGWPVRFSGHRGINATGIKAVPNPRSLLPTRNMANPILRQQWQADRKEG